VEATTAAAETSSAPATPDVDPAKPPRRSILDWMTRPRSPNLRSSCEDYIKNIGLTPQRAERLWKMVRPAAIHRRESPAPALQAIFHGAVLALDRRAWDGAVRGVSRTQLCLRCAWSVKRAFVVFAVRLQKKESRRRAASPYGTVRRCPGNVGWHRPRPSLGHGGAVEGCWVLRYPPAMPSLPGKAPNFMPNKRAPQEESTRDRGIVEAQSRQAGSVFPG